MSFLYELVNEFLTQPTLVSNFFVYHYEHIDLLELMPKSDDLLSRYRGYDKFIDEIKEKFKLDGWEGDGEIRILWLPPFCDLLYQDTFGIITWFVKQENNGTSFICSPHKLNFNYLNEQNQY